MRPVSATYRLQFRNGVDFQAAAEVAPYLARLGVSHLYASPLFAATDGSTHGYDVTDHGRFDEALGGNDGFAHMAAALKAEGLGLILDIVPNHMAASPRNPWWADVLRLGRNSPFAGHFDIDWSAPRLVLPILGVPYGEALANGDIGLGVDDTSFALTCHGTPLPLSPTSTRDLAAAVDIDMPEAALVPGAFAVWIADPAARASIDAALARANADRDLVHRLHEAQAYRLAHWRLGRDGLTYRRFFEVTDLVGVKVETDAVFDDVHRFLFDLVERGDIDGVRIDHVDGLADPTGYLAKLRDALPRPVPIWVEKILARDEPLQPEWPVAGTTGYEFSDAVTNLVIDRSAAHQLQETYEDAVGATRTFHDMLSAAKREIMTRNLAAELGHLVRLAEAALATDASARDIGPDTLRRALIALAGAMPVYRTYLTGPPAAARDRAILEGAAGEARAAVDLDDPAYPVQTLATLLMDGTGADAAAFRVRFQQVTGALLAKAAEDTVFYRHHRLIAVNEVGGEPDRVGLSRTDFHAAMSERLAAQPLGLSTTATHDTKRGEDARMRIAAIAEAPDDWERAVTDLEAILPTEGVDPDTRYLFYQTLLGAWDATDPALGDRMQAYMLKAAREAKRRTSWVDTDADYEERLATFVDGALASERFRATFADAAAPYLEIGARKSLVQLALKLTAPGIPDIYQGTEWADLSLVDPDNRRPVDFAARRAVLDGTGDPPDALAANKTALMCFGLALRSAAPSLFAGVYLPLETAEHHVGFTRGDGAERLLVLADLSGRGAAPPGPTPAPPDLTRAFGTGAWRVETAWPASHAGRPPEDIDLTAALAEAPVLLAMVRRT